MKGDDLLFISLPTYDGRAELMSCWRFFNTPTASLRRRLLFGTGGGSLLALSFNSLWTMALNLQVKGFNIKYFGMMHSDVIPQDFWLDILYEELHSKFADVVSCVIPIKDDRGLTSTAIDDPENKFEVTRRLTSTEVQTLPETFSAADCGYPDRALLVNTGCWLCRFDRDWRFKVHFTINDRIIRDSNGEWKAQVEPEDWNFSRQLHALGRKVYATRKVKVEHVGGIRFNNWEPFGKFAYDETFADKFGHMTIGEKLCGKL